ncbi:MAG TPA: TorF family putative porin [Rhizomicrobium sp.]
MKNVCIGLAIAVLAVAPGAARAADWGHLYSYVDWASDYRFYGASESNRHSVEQGGLHWAAPDNYYAGVFVTGVDAKDYRNTSYEVDLYGGRHVYFDGNDLNLEALYSFDPDTAGHPTYTAPGTIYPTYNFFSVSAELTHSFGKLALGGKLIVEPRPDSHGGLLWSLNGTASYGIADWLKASADLGHQWVALRTPSTHWDIGATATWRQQWALDVRYYGTDISVANCYGTNWCEPAVVAKVTYSFMVL